MKPDLKKKKKTYSGASYKFSGNMFSFSNIIRWRTLEAKPNNIKMLPRDFYREMFFSPNISRWKNPTATQRRSQSLPQTTFPSTDFHCPHYRVFADHDGVLRTKQVQKFKRILITTSSFSFTCVERDQLKSKLSLPSQLEIFLGYYWWRTPTMEWPTAWYAQTDRMRLHVYLSLMVGPKPQLLL